jgi:hypothetical protein
VTKFRLGDEGARAAPARPARRPQPQQSAARPVAALKTVSTGHGSAAVAKQAEPDSWAEF